MPERRLHLYGIRNCDTMKKARAWLTSRGIDHVFHDYKVEGADRAKLAAWVKVVGWETLLNRAGTTFRGLPDASNRDLDERRALALMLEHPAMIKRPVLEVDGKLLVGFSPEKYSALE